MAQYNYNSYRRPSASRYNPQADRIFVPVAPGPGPQVVENPFFQGEQPQQYEQPQGVQHYGTGVHEEPIDKLAYAYGEEAKAEALKVQAEAQAAADTARAKANEGIMTGDINPANPAAAAVLDAMGVEVTAGMFGKSALEPDELIKNVYGPRVAAGSLPSAEDDLVIQSRRRREAEARAKVDSYIAKNYDNLAVGDIAGLYNQHYQTFPEFGPDREPPKTREEMFAEQKKAEEEQFKSETQGIAQKLGLPNLPFKRDKDGTITTDVGTLQMVTSSMNMERSAREAAGREVTSSVNRQMQALDLELGTKPANLRSVEGRAWLVKEAAINKKKAKLLSDAETRLKGMGAIGSVSGEVGQDSVAPEPVPDENGKLNFNSSQELGSALQQKSIQPGIPFTYRGVMMVVDENYKPRKVSK